MVLMCFLAVITKVLSWSNRFQRIRDASSYQKLILIFSSYYNTGVSSKKKNDFSDQDFKENIQSVMLLHLITLHLKLFLQVRFKKCKSNFDNILNILYYFVIFSPSSVTFYCFVRFDARQFRDECLPWLF